MTNTTGQSPNQESLVDQEISFNGTEDDLKQLVSLLNPILQKIVEARVERESGQEMMSGYSKAHVEAGWEKSF